MLLLCFNWKPSLKRAEVCTSLLNNAIGNRLLWVTYRTFGERVRLANELAKSRQIIVRLLLDERSKSVSKLLLKLFLSLNFFG